VQLASRGQYDFLLNNDRTCIIYYNCRQMVGPAVELKLGVDKALIEITVQKSSPYQISSPLHCIDDVAILPVVQREVPYSLVLLLRLMERCGRCQATGNKFGVRNPMDSNSISLGVGGPWPPLP
jgi:hypothetical protein